MRSSWNARGESRQQGREARNRLPALDEEESFASYVQTVQQHRNSAHAAEIERARYEQSSWRKGPRQLPPLPTAGVAGTADAGADEATLPAGRFDEATRKAAGERSASAARAAEGALRDALSGFDRTPRQVKAHLDEHVIAQEQAKRALSVAVCDHYNFARACLEDPTLADAHHIKPNILLLGPSGVGKTHLMRALSKLIGVPFVRGDATKFSATGFVGGDVDDLVRSLVPAAAGDVRLAEHGIVYIDEVDKLADGPDRRGGLFGGGGGVNTRDVQSSLLKLMEDGEAPQISSAQASSPSSSAAFLCVSRVATWTLTTSSTSSATRLIPLRTS